MASSRLPPCRRTVQIPLLVFIAGLNAAVGQIIVLREVIVLFSGNELSVGIVLAAWLAWTATGSALAGWLVRDRFEIRGAVAAVECLCGLSLPLTVIALRLFRALLQAVPGELLGPVPMALACLACLAAFCGFSGSLFTLGAQLVQSMRIESRSASSYVYLLDTAGFAVGGVVTSLALLRFLGPIQIALAVALLSICVGTSLFFGMRDRQVVLLSVVSLVLAAPVLLFIAPRIEILTLRRLWRGFELVDFSDSIYGRLSVLRAGDMRSVYDSGSILANIPDPAAAEESVHYALLEHPAPKNVLLIGGGINGSIVEVLKHSSLARLDYVEIDPKLIGMMRRNFSQEFARAFSDRRVHLHEMDGRRFLESSASVYDVILINVPDPTNAQLNRFYTVEFFRSAREHLASAGVLALQLHASEDYISPELAGFLRCINRSLREVFPKVIFIPGESFHFFASTDASALTDDPQVLISRLQSRKLATLYVREYFIPFRMTPDRMVEIGNLIDPRPDTSLNEDFRPAAYYFSSVLWSAQFDSGHARLLQTVNRIRYSTLIKATVAVSMTLLLLFAVSLTPRKCARVSAVWCVMATGYTLMTLQLLLLLAFQSVFGYVYHELALLIGMFMGGIAAGSMLGMKLSCRGNPAFLARSLAINQFFLAVSAPSFLFLVHLLASHLQAAVAVRLAFSALAFLLGISGGYQFPAATGIHLDARPGAKGLATLYSVDLLGGCAGALLLSGFLIPVFGFWKVAWFTCVVNIAPALLATRARVGSPTTILRPASDVH